MLQVGEEMVAFMRNILASRHPLALGVSLTIGNDNDRMPIPVLSRRGRENNRNNSDNGMHSHHLGPDYVAGAHMTCRRRMREKPAFCSK